MNKDAFCLIGFVVFFFLKCEQIVFEHVNKKQLDNNKNLGHLT